MNKDWEQNFDAESNVCLSLTGVFKRTTDTSIFHGETSNIWNQYIILIKLITDTDEKRKYYFGIMNNEAFDSDNTFLDASPDQVSEMFHSQDRKNLELFDEAHFGHLNINIKTRCQEFLGPQNVM